MNYLVTLFKDILYVSKVTGTQNKKILFIPDRHMGENVAYWLGIKKESIAYWPSGSQSTQFNLAGQDSKTLEHFNASPLILFDSFCGVHTLYTPEMASYWQSQGFTTLAHPECTNDLIRSVDGSGSTAYLFDQVTKDLAGSKKYAIATENHMVMNLKDQASANGIEVVNMAEAKIENKPFRQGCGCATMSRNDPPHLVATLDLLRQGKSLEANLVKPGDVINEQSGSRSRLSNTDQNWIVDNAKKALQKMIEITEN